MVRDVVKTTRRDLTSYRQRLVSGGKRSENTRTAKAEFLNSLIWGEEDRATFVSQLERPVTLARIGQALSPTSPQAIYELLRGERKLYKLTTLYDILKLSGLWDHYNGEPLGYGEEDGRTVLVSERFPVVFSYTGTNPDVSWIPRLRNPDSIVTELAILFLSSATPVAQSNLGIVDHIIIEKQPQERTYVEKNIKQMLSYAFNVPIEFFKSPDNRRVGKFGEVNKPHLQIGSQMVGSYFQNVVGIFSVEDGKVVKRIPQIRNTTQRRAVLRAMTDNGADLSNPYQIRFTGSGELLDLTKQCAETLGYSTGEVTPMLNENYRLTPVSRNGNILVASAVNHAPSGRNIITRIDDNTIVVGKVMGEDDGSRNLVIELYETPREERQLYQEFSSRLSITGGRDAVRKYVQGIQPKNPFKLLTYLRTIGYEVPLLTPLNPQDEFQNFVSDIWDGDLDRLAETLEREGRNYLVLST